MPVLDRSRLPGDLWVRMTWTPKEGSEPDERPIVLITDRRRLMIGLIPAVLGILLLSAPPLARVPVGLLILPPLALIAAAPYGGGGQNGYYQVKEDGGLGDLLRREGAPVVTE